MIYERSNNTNFNRNFNWMDFKPFINTVKFMTLKKKFKNEKLKRIFLSDDVENLTTRVEKLEMEKERKQQLALKITRMVFISTLVILALASIYSLFFKL